MKNNIGHNSPEQLNQIARNIIHLEDEKKAISEQLSETYLELKSAGYNKNDVAAIKKIITEQRKRNKNPDDYDAQKDLFSFYAKKIAPELN
jgi:uncharacterized protein (UPF0335 family)